MFCEVSACHKSDMFIDLLGMAHLHLAISQAKGPSVKIRCNASRVDYVSRFISLTAEI